MSVDKLICSESVYLVFLFSASHLALPVYLVVPLCKYRKYVCLALH